jgi:superfamily I DNA/RNA helicase
LGLQYLGSKYGSLKSAETSSQVFLMTYHSSKGLDFEAVFLPRLHESLEIWRDDNERAKTLFFVALTRSRRDLYLTYTGKPHRFVQKIPMRLVHQVEIPEPEVEESEEDDVIVF